ncbi:MAG: hypothetical protein ACRDP7_23325 [Trebonia sp.]
MKLTETVARLPPPFSGASTVADPKACWGPASSFPQAPVKGTVTSSLEDDDDD